MLQDLCSSGGTFILYTIVIKWYNLGMKNIAESARVAHYRSPMFGECVCGPGDLSSCLADYFEPLIWTVPASHTRTQPKMFVLCSSMLHFHPFPVYLLSLLVFSTPHDWVGCTKMFNRRALVPLPTHSVDYTIERLFDGQMFSPCGEFLMNASIFVTLV